VSVRYVQQIFEESGLTFTAYLTERRLTAAYKALRRRAPVDVPVSTIAFDCGFANVSHFNRSFRQRFGCTPSDVRNAARAFRDGPDRG
jgi:AraC-like DNA-binding protein